MNNLRNGLVTAALLAFTAAQGCTVDDVDDRRDDDFRIINGAPAPSNVIEYAATIGIHLRSGNQVSIDPFCSGTLITDTVVMTAAHCCDEASNFSPNFNEFEPAEVAVYFGEGPAFVGTSVNGDFYGVSEVEINPAYDRFALHNDICLLRLEVPNTDDVPVPHLPAASGLSNADAGTDLDHVGFGYSDLAFSDYGVKLHAELPIAGMGCTIPGCPGGSPTATQFSYVQSGAGLGPCNGDSGGPQFIDRGGTTYVAGITSYGDAACHQYGVSTRVDAFEAFIDGFIGGGGGGGGALCGDGTCDVGESCDGRNGTTSCGDCPGRLGGRPSRRYCYVDGVCEGPGC